MLQLDNSDLRTHLHNALKLECPDINKNVTLFLKTFQVIDPLKSWKRTTPKNQQQHTTVCYLSKHTQILHLNKSRDIVTKFELIVPKDTI